MARQKIIIGSSTAQPCNFDGSELEMSLGLVSNPLISVADAIRGLLGRLHKMGIVCLSEPRARLSISKDNFKSFVVIDVEDDADFLSSALIRYCSKVNHSEQMGLFDSSLECPKETLWDDVLELVDNEAVGSKFALSSIQFNDTVSVSVDGEVVGEFSKKIKKPPINCPIPNPVSKNCRAIYFGYNTELRTVFFRDEETMGSIGICYDPAFFHAVLIEVGERINPRVDIQYREVVSGRKKIELILEGIKVVDDDQSEMF